MVSEKTDLEAVKNYLKLHKISTLDQIKKELFTNSTMTVFRKLKSLGYLSSYSHRGKYYTLESIADFDETGLWSFNSIWF
jgi:arginine repressor